MEAKIFPTLKSIIGDDDLICLVYNIYLLPVMIGLIGCPYSEE
jgi:hypothetical protein